MAVNKNFVVKNGLEVNTNLILADAATDKVGIGTTVPGYTLDVAGGIGATSVYAAGFSTFIGDVKIGSAQTTLTAIGNSVGVGTDTPSFLLDVRSAVSTGATSLYIKGDARITGKLDVAGDITYDEVTGRNLYITGLSTFVGLSSAQDVRVGAALSVVGVSTFHSAVKIDGAIDANSDLDVDGRTDLDDLIVTGVSTFSAAIDANGALDVDGHTELDDVNVSGASTFAGNIDANGDLDVDGTTNLDVLDVDGATNFGADVVFAGSGANITFDKSTDDIIWNDNAEARFGTSGDLSIYHDGSHSYINDAGTGDLRIIGSKIEIRNAANNETITTFNQSGSVDIYYDNSVRLQTTGIGASVQGSVGIRTNLEVAGVSTLGSANIVAAGGTFQVGAGGTVLYVDTDGTLTIGSATTLATVSLNGGSIPSIGLVIALGG